MPKKIEDRIESSEPQERLGRIQKTGAPFGTPTPEAISDRAYEIAEIEGREGHPTPEDFRAAAEELRQRPPAEPEEETRFEQADSRDPTDPATEQGLVENQQAQDENELPAQETEEGVEEAAHEQMLAARREELEQQEREETEEDEQTEPRKRKRK